jgi:tetratricopeptide (TPR) repeat protein
MTGDHPRAVEVLEAALGIYREIGHRSGEAEALNETGTLCRLRGDLGQAGMYHQLALDPSREISSAWNEAHALSGLGRCAIAGGQAIDAQASLQQARSIFKKIGAAEAATISAELDAMTAARPDAK